ncbi:MAG: Neuraminidase (Sialidase)-like protein [Candidatus Hydrogenedentes bacterium]|nr:Neuraminidase (Sialidase)-like protein [Candidatus Hydrogenedentota bacterium]
MTLMAAFALTSVMMSAADEAPFCEAAMIFDPEAESHGHVHASCVIECPNGDLRAVWYENGTPLPPPYYEGDQDKSADVRIGSARKPAGAAAWEAPFVITDTFGVSDNNPCLAIDRENRLWLVHATLLAVPENAWGSGLVHYHVSADYDAPGVPKWLKENILAVHPHGFVEAMMAPFDAKAKDRDYPESMREKSLKRIQDRMKDPLKCRLGWMPRAHPLIRSDGAVVVPLANENYGLSAMAITGDGGNTWTIGNAVPGAGLIQPTVVEFPDGLMLAFFRNGNPANRIMRSESRDGGMNWTPPVLTDLLHPGSGIEAVLLKNGHLLMIYNDTERDPRDHLAVSISEDRGATWSRTRHLETTPGGRFDYPSLVQAKDGSLHATYSYNLKTIKHVHFNEAWVQQGD